MGLSRQVYGANDIFIQTHPTNCENVRHGNEVAHNCENTRLTTVKTSKDYTSNPPTHPKYQFDILCGNVNVGVTSM